MALDHNQTTGLTAIPDNLLNTRSGAGSMWIQFFVDNNSTNNTIISGGSNADGDKFYRIYLRLVGSDMHLAVQSGAGVGGNALYADTVLSLNTQHYALITTDGSTIKIYLNGGSAESITVTGGSNNGNWFGDEVLVPQSYRIGALIRTGVTSQWFGGKLANLFLWDMELTEANGITMNANPYKETILTVEAGNQIHGWGMDRGNDGFSASGDTVYDLINGGHGVAAAGTTWFSCFGTLGLGGSLAEGHNDYHSAEHTGPSGNIQSQIWYWLAIQQTGNADWGNYYNAGIGNTKTGDTDTRIQALLDLRIPRITYLHIGLNDLGGGIPLATILSNLDSILSKVTAAGSDLVVLEAGPNSNWNETQQSDLKVNNAAYEKWCLDNSIPYAPLYQEMAETNVANEDDLESAYDDDGVHPNVAGYTRMGTLTNSSAVPDRSRTWGKVSFPTWPNESWDWFLLNGASSISGDGDTGTLVLPENDTADGPVKCLESGTNQITLTPTVGSGTVETYYRTSATNFDRNDGAAWTLYSSPFNSSNPFIQVRQKGVSVADANVNELLMSWAPTVVTTLSAKSKILGNDPIQLYGIGQN